MAVAPRLVAQTVRHCPDPGVDLAHLPIYPRVALLLGGTRRTLEPCKDRRVGHAVGKRLPGAYLGALAPRRRYQFRDRGHAVQILDDDARIEHRAAVFHDQAGNLAERVRLMDASIGSPDVLDLELIVDALLGHHDAHLAHVRARQRSQQSDAFRHARSIFCSRPVYRQRPSLRRTGTPGRVPLMLLCYTDFALRWCTDRLRSPADARVTRPTFPDRAFAARWALRSPDRGAARGLFRIRLHARAAAGRGRMAGDTVNARARGIAAATARGRGAAAGKGHP